jgi:hypothetical protein
MTTKDECPVGKALEQLSDKERKDIQAVLDNSVSSAVISRWFTVLRKFKGCTTPKVNDHRGGECGCS